MFFLNSDGTVMSFNNDNTFGWWLTDIEVNSKNCGRNENDENINVQKVNCVENQKVSEEICKCCKENKKEKLYTFPVEKIIELLDEINSKDRLLLAIIRPALWNKIYGTKSEFSAKTYKKIKHNITDNNFKTSKYESAMKQLKLYNDEPINSLESNLKEVGYLLKDVRQEIIEMRRTLLDLKQNLIEEEIYIEDLIQKSIMYTQDILDTKFLDDILILLNNQFSTGAIQNWPFYSDSTITYSNIQRNFIV